MKSLTIFIAGALLGVVAVLSTQALIGQANPETSDGQGGNWTSIALNERVFGSQDKESIGEQGAEAKPAPVWLLGYWSEVEFEENSMPESISPRGAYSVSPPPKLSEKDRIRKSRLEFRNDGTGVLRFRGARTFDWEVASVENGLTCLRLVFYEFDDLGKSTEVQCELIVRKRDPGDLSNLLLGDAEFMFRGLNRDYLPASLWLVYSEFKSGP